jgi:hypothetical protein
VISLRIFLITTNCFASLALEIQLQPSHENFHANGSSFPSYDSNLLRDILGSSQPNSFSKPSLHAVSLANRIPLSRLLVRSAIQLDRISGVLLIHVTPTRSCKSFSSKFMYIPRRWPGVNLQTRYRSLPSTSQLFRFEKIARNL